MIKVKIDDKELKVLLADLRGKMADMSPVMKVIAGIMHQSVEEGFEKEGPGWVPLKASTIRQRARKGRWPGKMLQASGQLVSSISDKYTSNSAMVGTNKIYAAIQQLGGEVSHPGRERVLHFKTYKRGANAGKTRFSKKGKATYGMKASVGPYKIRIPARPYLKLSDPALNDIRTAIMNYLIQGH